MQFLHFPKIMLHIIQFSVTQINSVLLAFNQSGLLDGMLAMWKGSIYAGYPHCSPSSSHVVPFWIYLFLFLISNWWFFIMNCKRVYASTSYHFFFIIITRVNYHFPRSDMIPHIHSYEIARIIISPVDMGCRIILLVGKSSDQQVTITCMLQLCKGIKYDCLSFWILIAEKTTE